MSRDEIIGVDVGYGYTKVVTFDARVIFQSLVGPAKKQAFSLSDMPDIAGETVSVGEEAYFVGKKAELCETVFSLRTRDWVQSNIYAALLTSALIRGTK